MRAPYGNFGGGGGGGIAPKNWSYPEVGTGGDDAAVQSHPQVAVYVKERENHAGLREHRWGDHVPIAKQTESGAIRWKIHAER